MVGSGGGSEWESSADGVSAQDRPGVDGEGKHSGRGHHTQPAERAEHSVGAHKQAVGAQGRAARGGSALCGETTQVRAHAARVAE